MKNIRITALIVTILGLFQLMVMGQSGTTQSFTIVKAPTAKVTEAHPLLDNPKIEDTTTLRRKLNYSILPKQIDTKYEVIPITAAKVKGEPLEKLYNSLVKVGIGLRQTINGEVYVSNDRSKNTNIGLYARHLSETGVLDKVNNPGFYEENITLYGKHIFNKSVIDANAYFDRNVIRYYGYNPDVFSLSDTEVKQRYNIFGGKVGLTPLKFDSNKYNTTCSLNYYVLNDYFNTNENSIIFKGNTGKIVKKDVLMGIALFKLGYTIDYNNLIEPNGYKNSALIELKPQIKSKYQDLDFTLGFDFDAAIDSNKTKISAYPVIYANYPLFDHSLLVYLGVDGKTYRNSFRSTVAENPYFRGMGYLPLGFTKQNINIVGGVKGNAINRITYNVQAAYSQYSNMPLFVLDSGAHGAKPAYNNSFTYVYDDVKQLALYGEIAYQQSEKLKLLASVQYNKYTTKTELHAWYKPEWEVNLTGLYNLHNKIVAHADVFMLANQYIKYPELVLNKGLISGDKLKPMVDVNIGFEYRYSKLLGAFLDFNNLAASKYYRYANYQVYSLNAILGVKYAF